MLPRILFFLLRTFQRPLSCKRPHSQQKHTVTSPRREHTTRSSLTCKSKNFRHHRQSYTMNRQQQFLCTMVTNTAGTFPSTNAQHQLSCIMMNVETGDFLRDHADNIWFVLGAYFFAFFPWAIMNNIDFISEKWRTCRRTRTLA